MKIGGTFNERFHISKNIIAYFLEDTSKIIKKDTLQRSIFSRSVKLSFLLLKSFSIDKGIESKSNDGRATNDQEE